MIDTSFMIGSVVGVVVVSGTGVISGTGDKGVTFNTLGATGGDKCFGVVFRRGMTCERGRGSVGDDKGGILDFGAAVWKISASLCNAHKLGLEISHGEAGEGFWRAVMRSKSVLVAASADDVRIIGILWREKSTMSESRCDLVEGM